MAKLWGTRFKKGLDPSVLKFTSSISYDKRLAEYDIDGSMAHARMLGRMGIISKRDAHTLVLGLKGLKNRLRKGGLKIDEHNYEDIHSAIIGLLKKRVGKVAMEKLHTARSRNDQVSLDMRLYCRYETDAIVGLIRGLQKSILEFSRGNIDVIIPAYTHLQHAQCVLMAHQMLAYVEMLERDKSRIKEAKARADEMPLGSGALRGTSLKINRQMVAKELKFSKVSRNSVDSVSSRDFVMELLADLGILGVHLSRLAEDLILWSTKEFSFIEIDNSFTTGSSMMPNKTNPDVLELIRGFASAICANFSSVTMMMKGLPLSYNRDLQLDKLPLFSSVETVKEVLPLFSSLIKGLKIKKENIKMMIMEDEFLFATDIAEFLIKNGHTYREAHDITGNMVKYCVEEGKEISEIPEWKLKRFSKRLTSKAIEKLTDPMRSVSSVKSEGGTNPVMVKMALKRWRSRLKDA